MPQLAIQYQVVSPEITDTQVTFMDQHVVFMYLGMHTNTQLKEPMNFSKRGTWKVLEGVKGRGKKTLILKVKKIKLPLNVYQDHLDTRTQIVASTPKKTVRSQKQPKTDKEYNLW